MTNAPRIHDTSEHPAPTGDLFRTPEPLTHPAGMAEAPSAFLPHPWVDLGSRPLENIGPAIGPIAETISQTTQPLESHGGIWDERFKRVLDVGLSVLFLTVLAPLMGLITVLLLVEKGPVLYKQTRVGRARARFTCLKFRTMRPNAEDDLRHILRDDAAARAEWALHQKLTLDPRITTLGRFLRESSLDELPQLFNVLRGDMSLVGPRPIIAPECSGYHGDRAYYRNPAFEDYARTRPGITGLWQVSGRHKTSYGERVRLDRSYARNRSLWMDLKILWQTLWVVLGCSGR